MIFSHCQITLGPSEVSCAPEIIHSTQLVLRISWLNNYNTHTYFSYIEIRVLSLLSSLYNFCLKKNDFPEILICHLPQSVQLCPFAHKSKDLPQCFVMVLPERTSYYTCWYMPFEFEFTAFTVW